MKTMAILSRPVAIAAAFAFTTAAHAADYVEPRAEMPPEVVYEEVPYGNWYIRGDMNYHWSKLRGTEYITYGCCVPDPGTDDFDETSLKGSLSLGGGVGYRITPYLRTDFTADYWFKSDFRGTSSGTCGGVPCTSSDESSYEALLLMANAYADLGTYYGITPYVGAGVGGAYLMWDDLENDIGFVTTHEGADNWRFAWSLMAGASYCLTNDIDLDLGYRFTQISGGRMFEQAGGVGPGFDDGLNVHEVRAGLRYNFGGGGEHRAGCGQQQMVSYEEPPAYEPPVYK